MGDWLRSKVALKTLIFQKQLEAAPQVKIKILRQYKDCLSRQVGEAIANFLSKDSLLNNKNEYIQKCISRITVEEDKYARKKRLLEKEEEERKEEQEVLRFKEL